MYAIVDIAGQQFKVKKDQKIFVHRLEGEPGNQVDFDRVLLIDNDSNVSVGAPVIQGAMISAKILEHLKGDKVIVFKKWRRKGYRVKNGHRQYLTQILIEEIIEKGAKPKLVAEKKAVVAKVAEPNVTEESKPIAAEKEVVTPKAEAKPVVEKKAPAAKKPAAEKASAAKKPAAAKAAPAKKPAAPKKPAAKKAAPKKAAKPAVKKVVAKKVAKKK
jgi:large subunit ribosomal protein L21